MKIVAGLGSADAYNAYVDAGADEVFCGYVPETWAAAYGMALPLNRREVRYYDVQLGGRSELLRLSDRIAVRGVPATITFNSPHYIPQQYAQIEALIRQCLQDGFRSFIVADPALLVWLHQQGLHHEVSIHISGEMGEMNRGMLALCRTLGASRVIFHRKVPIADMAAMIRREQQAGGSMEYEAFILNEMCHFHGAYCASLHCDELAHLCRLPYRLGPVHETDLSTAGPDTCASDPLPPSVPADLPGATGCGLCALWALRAAGVTHLKVVGRGNRADAMVRDIRALREALDVLALAPSEQDYQAEMKRRLFPGGCSGQCYYR